MTAARDKARWLSRRMEWLATALGAITGMAVLYGLWLLCFDPQRLGRFAIAQFGEQVGAAAPAALSGLTVLLLAATFVGQAALLLWALLALRRAFRQIADDEVVSVAAARLMRLSGIAFLTSTLAMVLLRPLASLILSLDMPAGYRFLAVGVGTQELMTLLVSGVLIVFGHLTTVAAAVDDENRRFV
jgi:hypothetical protein